MALSSARTQVKAHKCEARYRKYKVHDGTEHNQRQVRLVFFDKSIRYRSIVCESVSTRVNNFIDRFENMCDEVIDENPQLWDTSTDEMHNDLVACIRNGLTPQTSEGFYKEIGNKNSAGNLSKSGDNIKQGDKIFSDQLSMNVALKVVDCKS